MKKLFALLLSATMALSLVACGGSSESSTPTTTTTPATTESTTTESTTTESTSSATSEIKVGAILLHDENSGYDMAHIEGIEGACADLGIDLSQVTFRYNIPEDESCYDEAADLADAGCDIIFSNSYGHQTYMQLAAADFPDTTFVSCTGDTAASSGLSNFHNIFPHTFESRYVSGVVAGMKLAEAMEDGSITDPKIGYVGAYPYAEVVSGYTAFLLGIQSIVPEAYMEVNFTNSWFDLTAEGEAAKALLSRGCVIIGQHADSTGAPSAVQAAYEAGTVAYSVGYNVDMTAVAPDVALTSAQNVWAKLYGATLETFLSGAAIPADYAAGIAHDAVAISVLGDACAAGTQEAVDAAWAGIADGSLQVFDTSTFTVGGEEVTTVMGLDTDGDWVPDSGECIADGAFQESVLRSAPYFALQIDGITLLN